MLKLSLSFNTFEELQTFLAQQVQKPIAPIQKAASGAQDPVMPTATAGAGAATDPAAAPRKPGRPKKAAEQPADPAPVGGPSPHTEPAALTEGDVRAALMKVNERHGADGLKATGEVLKPFGVARISELKPEQYAQVIDAAMKAAA